MMLEDLASEILTGEAAAVDKDGLGTGGQPMLDIAVLQLDLDIRGRHAGNSLSDVRACRIDMTHLGLTDDIHSTKWDFGN